MKETLTPKRIVEELDRYIVGQAAAKRMVAIALRNRIRRQKLVSALQDEVMPKNILMIGPTGVGKTEIARRLARLVQAPFVKVEATRFTEVGYVGRDVESMVRELVETAIRLVRGKATEGVRERAEELAYDRLARALLQPEAKEEAVANPFEALFGAHAQRDPGSKQDPKREAMKEALRRGEYAEESVELELEENPSIPVFGGNHPHMEEMGMNLQEMFGGMMPKRRRHRRLPVREALPLLVQEEAQKLVDQDRVIQDAIARTESSGIIFIDEIDKVAGRGGNGPDVSREGVQRDLLPIVEGSTVVTKYGPVKTDHILFIAAGAFHVAKPSDLIPELQGRFPVRVELDPLVEEDFRRILTEPQNSLTRQYEALLATDGVTVTFAPDGIAALAGMAVRVNRETEDIGARRLHTLMERLLEEVSYLAPAGTFAVTIDQAYVQKQLGPLVEDRNLAQYIL